MKAQNNTTNVRNNLTARMERSDNSACVCQYILDWVIYVLVLFWVVMLFVDGVFVERFGISRIETAYYIIIIALLFFRMIFVSIEKNIVLYMFILISAIMTGIIFKEPDWSILINDFRYLVRSIVIGALVYWCYTTSRWINYRHIRNIFIFYWFEITAFVLFHYFFGFGGVTGSSGKIKPIYTSYFKEGNIIAFSYLIAWFHLYTTSSSFILCFILTIIALIISTMMSSKAIILMILTLISFDFALIFYHKSIINRVAVHFVIIIASVGILFSWSNLMELLLQLFAKISPDGATILFRMNSQALITVLLGTRNIKALAMLDAIREKGTTAWLFGLGATDLINEKQLVESDPFDILKFYGLVGVVLYAVAIVAVWRFINVQRQLRKEAFGFYVFFVGIFMATIVVSSITGHILTAPGAMIILGLAFGTMKSVKLRHEMIWFWHRHRVRGR